MTTTHELLAPFLEAETPLGEVARMDGLPEDPTRLLDHLASAGVSAEARAAAWQAVALLGVLDPGEHPRCNRGHPVTAERKRVFLETLAATGSTVAAAEAATPWSTGARGGYSTFRDLRNSDPEFADAWDRAEQAALAAVESEIRRRAFEPERRPVFSKGELVGQHETYDNRLLVTLARRLNPDAWSERKQIEHSGQVEHRHAHGHTVVSIQARDVLLLEDEQREVFMGLLQQIATAKEGTDAKQEPLAIEHKVEEGEP